MAFPVFRIYRQDQVRTGLRRRLALASVLFVGGLLCGLALAPSSDWPPAGLTAAPATAPAPLLAVPPATKAGQPTTLLLDSQLSL